MKKRQIKNIADPFADNESAIFFLNYKDNKLFSLNVTISYELFKKIKVDSIRIDFNKTTPLIKAYLFNIKAIECLVYLKKNVFIDDIKYENQ